MSYPEKRWLLHLAVPAANVAPIADTLDPFVDSLNCFEVQSDTAHWTIDAVLRPGCDRRSLTGALSLAALAYGFEDPAVTLSPLENKDWLAQARADFPPFRIGGIFLHGSHHIPVPGQGPIRLRVDAGTAFGSGEHATTAGCLLALQALAKGMRIKRALDMGCGSGVLAMAMVRLWHANVTAVDIDPESVRVTRENARLNGVARYIRPGAGNGYAAPILSRAAPFDLIASNILARPLRRMAPSLAHALKPGGYAVLSGLLQWQEASVLAAHKGQGLHLVARYPIGEWQTLVLRK